jgi:hypothetical protein
MYRLPYYFISLEALSLFSIVTERKGVILGSARMKYDIGFHPGQGWFFQYYFTL